MFFLLEWKDSTPGEAGNSTSLPRNPLGGTFPVPTEMQAPLPLNLYAPQYCLSIKHLL